jgi:hypothetical protein
VTSGGGIGIDAGAWDRPIEDRGKRGSLRHLPDGHGSRGRRLRFDVLRETFARTIWAEAFPGPWATSSGRCGGAIPRRPYRHRHVDGLAQCARVEPVGRDWRFEFACSRD